MLNGRITSLSLKCSRSKQKVLGTNTSESLQLNVLVPMRSAGELEPMKLPETFRKPTQEATETSTDQTKTSPLPGQRHGWPYVIAWNQNSNYHTTQQHNLSKDKLFKRKKQTVQKSCSRQRLGITQAVGEFWESQSCNLNIPPSPVNVQEHNNWCCRSLPVAPPSNGGKSRWTPTVTGSVKERGLQTVFILRGELLLGKCWNKNHWNARKKKRIRPCLESTGWHPLTGQVTLFQKTRKQDQHHTRFVSRVTDITGILKECIELEEKTELLTLCYATV